MFPAQVRAILSRLEQAGFAACAVGGCVRDSLLGLTPHDWDLCTSALPRQVLDRFGKEQCIPTGLQHGTVTVKYGGKLYETTTFRTEGSYSDGRHPDSVAFVPDVKEDLARRDFTINAMAYSAEEGLIDPFGGQKDLARGLVRAVGVPHQRFTEDALRILRLYRFAARFGFEIDPATGQAARELCAHLDCVSTERITEELTRLLAAPKPGTWMEPAVFAVVLPELFTPENAPRFEAARAIIDTLPEGYDTSCTPDIFSQGQWQLLSIARAVAADPKLLLLDEITANLDAETERAVLRALKRATADRTVLSISHRVGADTGRLIPIGEES